MFDLELLKIELDGILDTSNDNIVVADGEGKILRVSSNCFSIYGKAERDLTGKTVYQLEEDYIFYPSVTAKVLKEKKEVQIMQETSTKKLVMATGIPLTDNNGQIVRIISFSHDLTEIQQLREDYEQLRVKMEQYESEIKELKENENKNKEERLVIKSKTMKDIYNMAQRVAVSDATVVLLGESGVGKNVIARMLHDKSQRKKGAFIELNCGAIPETLFESEIFGYESGAFTGADKNGKAGMIEHANKGTLFFDEIAELPLTIQVKLLKVLQEKQITRIGGSKAKKVDFRLIVATNQNLEEMVLQGKFRKDLFYRLNVIPITIPPLRERREDIYQLSQYYLAIFNKKYQTNKIFLSATIDLFYNYDWPGNVRELENLIERLVVTSTSNAIPPSSLPFVKETDEMGLSTEEWTSEALEQQDLTLQEALRKVEKSWLRRAYRQYKTTYEMAKYLGLSQSTVVRRLKEYKINSK